MYSPYIHLPSSRRSKGSPSHYSWTTSTLPKPELHVNAVQLQQQNTIKSSMKEITENDSAIQCGIFSCWEIHCIHFLKNRKIQFLKRFQIQRFITVGWATDYGPTELISPWRNFSWWITQTLLALKGRTHFHSKAEWQAVKGKNSNPRQRAAGGKFTSFVWN